MNKDALISFARRSLIGKEATADEQRTYHFQRVSQAVNYAFNTLLSQIPLDDSGKEKIESYYVFSYYNQPVKESGGYRYFGVSDSVVPVGEGKGIWYVQPSAGQTQAGRPLSKMSRPAIAAYNNIPVGGVMDDTVWRFGNVSTNRQIVLENIGDSPLKDIRKVDFGIVREFSSYGDEEEVIVPDGRYDLMMDFVRAWLKDNPVDNVNNDV